MQDQSTIREITLCLTGNIVQQEGKCCKALTCMAGMLCFFPFLLNCCDCYRRNVEKLYSISDTQYQMLGGVLQQCQSVQTVKIFVQDNFLTQQKTQLLEGFLTALPVLGAFTFSNCVLGINLQNQQYDNFDNLFSGLKTCKWILVSLLWDDNYYMTSNYQPKQGVPFPMMPNMGMQGMPGMGMPNMQQMQPGMGPMPPLGMMDSLNVPLGGQQSNPLLSAYMNSDPFSIALAQNFDNTMGGQPNNLTGPPPPMNPGNMTSMGLNSMMTQMTDMGNPYTNKML